MIHNISIGFIGQGWIGKHYADDFASRGYKIVRYGLEDEYVSNKQLIADCDIVFIAVPTPTTEAGFDDSAVRDALSIVGEGKIAVIKSTILPGLTRKLQASYPDCYVFHSPEFLVEKSAAYDAAHPTRNIIGIPDNSKDNRERAEVVLSVLAKAPYNAVMTSDEAEFVKYAGNCFLYSKVIFMNLLHDLVTESGCDYERIHEAMVADPRIGESHTLPIHDSGRGAGGHCFIKDFEAFRRMHELVVNDPRTNELLKAMVDKNNQLLVSSNKDLDLLTGVYGDLSMYSDET